MYQHKFAKGWIKMPLPGKLSVGILEEDNPQEAYFRYKPVLICDNDVFTVFEEASTCPDEGALRIVPDKNESSHFKIRMRHAGKYCLADLRGHAGENDKIRQNKNYQSSPAEKNRYIIYSDVIREGAPDSFIERITQPFSPSKEYTTRTLIEKRDDGTCAVYEKAQDEDMIPEPSEKVIDAARYDEFEIDGRPVFVLKPSFFMGDAPAPREETRPAREEIRPAAPAKPRAEESDKPWISRNPALAPRMPDMRKDPREQAIEMQTGFNPRRSKSLQEIIDDKWRHSRMEQLGHPVPGNAMGTPVETPVETAVQKVREAWNSPEARKVLLTDLCRIEGLGRSFASFYSENVPEQIRQEIKELEQQRDELAQDIVRTRENMTVVPEPAEKQDPNAIVTAVNDYFRASGMPLTRGELFRLVLAAAFGRVVLFTGKAGSDMNDTAELLLSALGLKNVTLFPDANAGKERMQKAVELAQSAGTDHRVWLVVRDNMSGEPLPACITEKAITVRLSEPDRACPFTWNGCPESALSLTPASLEASFRYDAELPRGAVEPVEEFRARLSRIGTGLSRRSLGYVYGIVQALIANGCEAQRAADIALSMGALPGLVACLPTRQLALLSEVTADYRECRSLLNEPVGIL